MLRNVSRTFALSIEQLPQPVRDVVTIAYLMFRVSDCIEDHEQLPADRKARILRLWAAALQGHEPIQAYLESVSDIESGGDPEIEVALQADEVVDALNTLPQVPRDILIHHICVTSQGMARWQ
jgi:farnesyl-diphosphate farnesyltransferase